MEITSRKRGRTRTREQINGVRALERGLSVLEVLSAARELSLSEIARRVELSYSTTYRLLETLRQQKFVAQASESGLYRIGIKSFEVGASFLSQGRLPEIAHGFMKQLVDDANETVNLAILDGHEAVYVHQVEGRQMVRMFTHIGGRTPLYCTGVGKILLAWLPGEEVHRLLKLTPLKKFTSHTQTGLRKILAELERVRAQDYALDDEERETGVRCVAAPVRGRRGETVAALSLSAPTSRLPKERVRAVAAKVKETAQQISTHLGYAE